MAIGSNPCGCPEGITNCAEAYDCITTHICPGSGIRIDEEQGCFGVALGSCLGFDAQGRIQYICGEAPAPGPCRRSFADLGDEFVICGSHGGAANLLAPASPQALQYAIAQGLTMIEVPSFSLADGVGTWAPEERNVDLHLYATNPASAAWALESSTWPSVTSDPGTATEGGNVTGRYALAPEARKADGGDGGYLGYGLPPFSLMLAAEGLRQVDGRALVNLLLSSPQPVRGSDVNAAIQAVGAVCAQPWAMITLGQVDTGYVENVTAANITACLYVTDPAAITPQEVIDSGATWAMLDAWQDDAVLEQWSASALSVLVRTNSRQYETTRAREAGASGIVCGDPVFASDRFQGKHYQWWSGRENAMGVLDYLSDQGLIVEARGYTANEAEGLFIYNGPEVVDHFPSDPVVLFQNELLGSLRPDDPESAWPGGSYQIDVFLRPYWESVPQQDGSRMGFAFGGNFDVDLSGAVVGAYGDRYRLLRTGYFCWVDVEEAGGTMRIERIDSGGGITPLGLQVPATGIEQGVMQQYTLTVTPTTIRWERSDGEFVEVTDSTYRGVWMYGVTQYANDGDNTDAWETAVRCTPLW